MQNEQKMHIYCSTLNSKRNNEKEKNEKTMDLFNKQTKLKSLNTVSPFLIIPSPFSKG